MKAIVKENNRKSSLFTQSFFLIVGGYIVSSLMVFRYGTAFSDEGFLYQWGSRILAGELPYTDFFLQIAPGTFYLQAALIKLFGFSILIGRIFNQIEGLFAGILIYLIVMRALKNRNAALVAMIISFAWSAALHIRYHWYTMDAGILILIGIYLFIRFIETGEAKMLALSGLSMGGSILFKQNMGIFIVAVGIILCVAHGLIQERMSIVKRMSVFTVATFVPIILFIAYYVWAGGDIYKLYLQTLAYPQKLYGYTSSFETLLLPLKVFLLIHKQDPAYYIGIFILLFSLFLIFAKLKSRFLNIIGAFLLLAIVLWDPGIFARFFIWTLNFLLFVAAILFSAYCCMKDRSDPLSFNRLALSLFAFANLYSGIMVGGGLGRFVGAMTSSFYIYGVLADMIENNARIKFFWEKTISWTQRKAIFTGTAANVILGFMMLVQNASFTPGMDFPLYKLNQKMHIEGAKGIIGESKYVNETESVVQYVKSTLHSANNRKEILVFPLNIMLYPLIGARNPTTYDALHATPFIPEFIPHLMAQLEKTPPEIIILQKRATQTTGPLREERVWVHQEAVDAVYRFVGNNYAKIYETELYYEVYKLRLTFKPFATTYSKSSHSPNERGKRDSESQDFGPP